MASKLKRIQVLVERGDYILSEHAQDYVEQNIVALADIESAILGADTIYKTEVDTSGDEDCAEDGYIHTILGPSRCGSLIYTCGKIVQFVNGRTYLFITAKPNNWS